MGYFKKRKGITKKNYNREKNHNHESEVMKKNYEKD